MILFRTELLLLASLTACSGPTTSVNTDATEGSEPEPLTLQSYIEQSNEAICNAAQACGVDDTTPYCEPSPYDAMDYADCTFDAEIAQECLDAEWTCFHGSIITAPIPPDICQYAVECPVEKDTDTGPCTCTVEWVAQIGDSLDCVADADLCRGDLEGGVWDADAKEGLGYNEYALAWSTLEDVDLGDGPVPLVFEDIPCGSVAGYLYLNRNGIDGWGPGDVISTGDLQSGECEDGGTVSEVRVLDVAF